MRNSILLFGNCCSGKSSLGNEMDRILGIKYLSFGDLKRKELEENSSLGNRIGWRIKNGLSIDPLDGLLMLKKYSSDVETIVLCGFPISFEEYMLFKQFYNIIFGVYLRISDIQVKKRFFERRICPICKLPGTVGSVCDSHNIPMVPRDDVNEKELEIRIKLFHERIFPFIDLARKSLFKMIDYDSLTLQPKSIVLDLKQKMEIIQ